MFVHFHTSGLGLADPSGKTGHQQTTILTDPNFLYGRIPLFLLFLLKGVIGYGMISLETFVDIVKSSLPCVQVRWHFGKSASNGSWTKISGGKFRCVVDG